MVLYIAKRFAFAVPILLGAMTIVFFAIQITGDPVEMMLPLGVTAADVEEFRKQMGLDLPIWQRYVQFMWNIMQGDFGVSYQYKSSALMLVVERLPMTLLLAFSAIILSILISIPIGVLAAVKKDTVYDWFSSLIVLITQSMPTFYVGILLILFFSVHLGWLPTSGEGSWKHLVLPSVTLMSFTVATIMRITRSEMLEVLPEQYMVTAQAKGLPDRTIIWKHAFKNATIQIITIVGLQLGNMISAAFVTEVVFAWPGIGRLAVSAVANRDIPVVLASVFISAAFFILINILVDLFYKFLDPRIKF